MDSRFERLAKAVREHLLDDKGHLKTCGGACDPDCVAIRAALVEPPTLEYTKLELTKWWAAKCTKCDWRGLSRDALGGEAIADTGDHNDCICPKCEAPIDDDLNVKEADLTKE
jgi:hypothetical protein